jgi:AcrR family transcriptional regulator
MIRMAANKKIRTVRRRNAAATRAAILTSAREAFVRAGYDGAGVREIARGAGVTAMLINRYFGSKQKLFAEVAAQTLEDPVILTPATLAAAHPEQLMAKALVEMTDKRATTLDGFTIMHRSGGSKAAARIQRKQIEKHQQARMTKALSGAHAEERAALLLSIVAGFQMMRQMIGLRALVEADSAVLVRILTPLLRQLVESPSRSRPD